MSTAYQTHVDKSLVDDARFNCNSDMVAQVTTMAVHNTNSREKRACGPLLWGARGMATRRWHLYMVLFRSGEWCILYCSWYMYMSRNRLRRSRQNISCTGHKGSLVSRSVAQYHGTTAAPRYHFSTVPVPSPLRYFLVPQYHKYRGSSTRYLSVIDTQ